MAEMCCVAAKIQNLGHREAGVQTPHALSKLWLHPCPWGCSRMLFRLLSPSLELRLFQLTRHLWAKTAKTKTKTKNRKHKTWQVLQVLHLPLGLTMQMTHPQGPAALLEYTPTTTLPRDFLITALPVGYLGSALQVKGKATQQQKGFSCTNTKVVF